MAKIFLFGASGHAKVVIDAIEYGGQHSITGLFDDAPQRRGTALSGYAVLGARQELLECRDRADFIVVSIGTNDTRARIAEWFLEHSFQLVSIIHPKAYIAREVEIGAGTVVMAGCVVNSSARIGHNAIINTGATVDHDCLIDDHVHVAPGCHLCGRVIVGKGAFIGAGTVIIPGVRIGAGAVVGAGSTVIRDVSEGARVAGSPCRPLSP